MHCVCQFMSIRGYMKNTTGVVLLRGAIKNGVLSTVAGTLGSGYRPLKAQRFSVSTVSGGTPGTGTVEVQTDGDIVPISGTGTFFLDGLQFSTN